MTVRVKLFGSLKQYLPSGTQGRQAALEVPTGGGVRDVMRLIGVPDEAATVILVNGEHVEADAGVKEGDTVSVFPPI
ncbi:MAG: MoaD/ThiS family protein [Candidatus Latescibacteria bacterium]|nr:MoaD/ThiS family protein [Candidatus Latescibacterota bacterium]